MYKNIMVNELVNFSHCELIDIRSTQKYMKGHIKNAKNIPFENLFSSPSKYLSKNISYYIYCQKGNKSKIMCHYLSNLGYNVFNIVGGYDKWLLQMNLNNKFDN